MPRQHHRESLRWPAWPDPIIRFLWPLENLHPDVSRGQAPRSASHQRGQKGWDFQTPLQTIHHIPSSSGGPASFLHKPECAPPSTFEFLRPAHLVRPAHPPPPLCPPSPLRGSPPPESQTTCPPPFQTPASCLHSARRDTCILRFIWQGSHHGGGRRECQQGNEEHGLHRTTLDNDLRRDRPQIKTGRLLSDSPGLI